MTETVEPMPVTEPWTKPWRWIPWDLHWHNATASGEPCEDPGCLVKHERPEPWTLAPDVIENLPPAE